MNSIFILQQDIGNLKKGRKFDSFGGIVSGITIEIEKEEKQISFANKKYFKLQKLKPKFRIGYNEFI